MSHFSVVVLVRQTNVPEPGHPNFESEIENEVTEMLSPFSENLDVEPYDRKCDCGEWTVARKADKLAAEETGLNWDILRKTYWELPENDRPEWDVYTKELRDAEKFYREELAPEIKPDEDCSDCHGTGSYVSTYNKLSKWDWWSIGNRWDGDFEEKKIPTIIRNVAFARDLQTAAYTPFAILSPREPHQGYGPANWNQRGEMGWFGVSFNENDNWDANANELFDKYAACFAVLVDCHI